MVTQKTLLTFEVRHFFFENTIKFSSAVDLNKCLKQISLLISLLTCAPILDVPSYLSTMRSALFHQTSLRQFRHGLQIRMEIGPIQFFFSKEKHPDSTLDANSTNQEKTGSVSDSQEKTEPDPTHF